MSDQAVREQLQRFVDDVTPAQLPAFGNVARRRRRHQMQRVSAAGVTVVLVLAAVLGGLAVSRSSRTSPAARTQSSLAGTSWRLTSVTDLSGTWTAPADTRWFVQFSAHAYAGNDGCNSVSGTLRYGTGTVTLAQGATTAMGCLGTDLDRPRQAFTALEGHQAAVTLSGRNLTLSVRTTTLSLVSRGTVPAPSVEEALVGPHWMLRSITAGGKTIPKAGDYGASLTFAEGGYRVDDGCNTGEGSVDYQQDGVIMTAGSQTAVYCQDRRTVTEAQKFAGAYSVKRDGPVLTLRNADRTYVFDVQGLGPFASQLVGTDWRLVSWRQHGSAYQVAAGTHAGIRFQVGPDRYVSMSDGCNTDTGNAAYKGAHIKLVSGILTARTCSTANTQIMGAFRTAIDSDVSAFVTTSTLSLSGNGVYLILERSTPKYDLPPPAKTASTATSSVTSSVTPLVGPTFMLRTLTVNGVPLPRVATLGATVTYAQSTFSAEDGCNTLSGSVAYADGAVVPADVAGSAMLCEGAHFQSVEQPFDALISARSRVALHVGSITLAAGGAVAELVVEDPANLGRDVVAGSWRVTSVATHEGVVSQPVTTTTAGITFDGSEFTMTDGCNGRSGAVTYGAVSLTFAEHVDGLVGCHLTGQAAEVEAALQEVTRGEASYEYQAGQVWLRVGDTSVGLSPILS